MNVLKMGVNIECDCGNSKTYDVEHKYHSASAESFTDLTGAIYDEKFQAKPTSDGMFISCRKCKRGFEVI